MIPLNVCESVWINWHEPERAHINGLSGAGCYGVLHIGRMSILASRLPGTKFICTCPHHVHRVAQGENGCHSQTLQIFPAEYVK